jgi:hypothetical protein
MSAAYSEGPFFLSQGPPMKWMEASRNAGLGGSASRGVSEEAEHCDMGEAEDNISSNVCMWVPRPSRLPRCILGHLLGRPARASCHVRAGLAVSANKVSPGLPMSWRKSPQPGLGKMWGRRDLVARARTMKVRKGLGKRRKYRWRDGTRTPLSSLEGARRGLILAFFEYPFHLPLNLSTLLHDLG